MFSGALEKACFGPSEIEAMRRALVLAENAIRSENHGTAKLSQRRELVARMIVQLAARGQLDPVVLCALAVKARRQANAATFRPYDRRQQASRPHERRVLASRKFA